MTIFIFVLALALVIAIHEFGHYMACRAFNVPVHSFSVGMGPVLLRKRDRRETEWRLSALPIGGYIMMDEYAHDMLHPFKKILISFAGPAINIVVAMIVFFVLAGAASTIDMITSIPSLYGDTATAVSDAMTFQSNDDLAGPVGAVHMFDQLETSFFGMAIVMFITMNIAVGIFNLLPVPPLDGGHIVVHALEMIFGKRVAEKVFNIFAPVGFVLLLILTAIVLFKDIARIV